MLRKAIADYEEKQFVGKAENITVGDMLDKQQRLVRQGIAQAERLAAGK